MLGINMSNTTVDLQARLFACPTAELETIKKWFAELAQVQKSDHGPLNDWLTQVVSHRQSLEALQPRRSVSICLKYLCGGSCAGGCGESFPYGMGYFGHPHTSLITNVANSIRDVLHGREHTCVCGRKEKNCLLGHLRTIGLDVCPREAPQKGPDRRTGDQTQRPSGSSRHSSHGTGHRQARRSRSPPPQNSNGKKW